MRIPALRSHIRPCAVASFGLIIVAIGARVDLSPSLIEPGWPRPGSIIGGTGIRFDRRRNAVTLRMAAAIVGPRLLPFRWCLCGQQNDENSSRQRSFYWLQRSFLCSICIGGLIKSPASMELLQFAIAELSIIIGISIEIVEFTKIHIFGAGNDAITITIH